MDRVYQCFQSSPLSGFILCANQNFYFFLRQLVLDALIPLLLHLFLYNISPISYIPVVASTGKLPFVASMDRNGE